MKHIKNNPVPVFISMLIIIPFRLAGISGRYLTVKVYTRLAGNTFFTPALILPATCSMGISFAIMVEAISAQMAIVFSAGLRLKGAVALTLVIGASIVLSILLGIMVAALLNRTREREMIVSVIIGQLSPVVYQFAFMVTCRLPIWPRDRGILLNRGIGIRSMVNVRNTSSVFKEILPFRFDGKTHSLFPPVIILLFDLALFYIQKAWLGTLARAVGMDEGTAGTLGIAGDWVHGVCIVISTVLAAMSQTLFVADLGTINVYTGHLGLDTFTTATILVGGAPIKKARMRNCLIGVVLPHVLFITSSMAGQNLLHNPSMGEYFHSSLAYGVIVAAIIINLRNERTEIQSI